MVSLRTMKSPTVRWQELQSKTSRVNPPVTSGVGGTLTSGAILDATPSCEFDVVEFDHVDGDVFDAVNRSSISSGVEGI